MMATRPTQRNMLRSLGLIFTLPWELPPWVFEVQDDDARDAHPRGARDRVSARASREPHRSADGCATHRWPGRQPDGMSSRRPVTCRQCRRQCRGRVRCGHFSFDDVPYGKYIVKELSAPSGYILSGRQYPVTISEDGETVELTAENRVVSVAIRKEDIYGKELAGAKMMLVNENGDTVDEWTSDGNYHIVRGLPSGEYILKEVAAPEGYVIATDISFNVDEYGKATVGGVETNAVTDDGIPCITMVDKAEKKPTVTVPPTGDTGRNVLGLILLVSGLCGIAYAAVKYRKLMKEMHELDTGLAALCPDMIEREEND